MLLTPALFVLIFGVSAAGHLVGAAGQTGGARVMHLVMGVAYIPMTAAMGWVSIGTWLRSRELGSTERLT